MEGLSRIPLFIRAETTSPFKDCQVKWNSRFSDALSCRQGVDQRRLRLPRP